MDRQYKAFISYRHRPLDMQVAKMIHSRIEHYRIPKALRKDGKKKLGIVFRDQEELPLSRDLTTDIREALDHSEYLIVICTPETDKSVWVREEISYFLSHHDHNHVLAVLAEGTSDKSFPRQLLEIRSPDGSLLETVEPLAANIVADTAGKRRRLFRVESLRILATMIGCAFDDLYRREQRYRIRRLALSMAVITVLAACFIGMLLNRNAEIRENYEQALRNQSQYLAAESLNALEDGDRLRAISLAIEALPEEGKERPHVSEAEYALGCAVGAYLSPGNAVGVQAVGMLPHTSRVEDYQINDSCTLLGSLSKDGMLVGWDLQSMKKLWSLSADAKGITGFLDDSRFVAWSEEAVFCIDVESGRELWRVPVSSFSSDSWASVTRVCVAGESRTLVAGCYSSFAVLDGESGEVLRCFPWPKETDAGLEIDPYSFRFRVSPDGSLLATQCSCGSDSNGVIVLDLNDGSIRLLRPFEGKCYIPDSYAFTGEGLFFYVSYDLSSEGAYTFLNMKSMVKDETVLHCEDLSSGGQLWETRHDFSSTGANDILLCDRTLTGKPILLYAYANHLDILDAENGAFLAQTEFASRLVGLDIFNQLAVCTTDSGERGIVNPKDFDTWHSTRSFVDNLSCGKLRAGGLGWVLQNNSDSIICYEPVQPDPSWTDMETIWAEPDGADGFHPDDVFIVPGCISVLDGQRLLLNDGDPSHPLREVRLPNDPDRAFGTKYSLCFCDNGVLGLFWSDASSSGVLYADTATGEYRVVPWSDEEQSLIGLCSLDDGRNWLGVCCKIEKSDGESRLRLFVHRLSEDLLPEKTLELGSFSGLTEWVGKYDNAGRLYVYLKDVGKCFCADLVKGTVTECGEGILGVFAAADESDHPADLIKFSQDGSRLAFRQTPDEYLLVRADGRTMYSIRSESQSILAVSFTPDGRYLLSVESDGLLRRYRAEDGELLSRSSLVYSYVLDDMSEISFRYTDSGFLALRLESYMDLISTEDWGVFAYVPQCRAYLEDFDSFICYGYSQNDLVFSCIRRYSLDSLISRGRSLLNGWEMSDSQRMRYGLD